MDALRDEEAPAAARRQEQAERTGLQVLWRRVLPYRRWLLAYCSTSSLAMVVALLALWAGNGFRGLGISAAGMVAVTLASFSPPPSPSY